MLENQKFRYLLVGGVNTVFGYLVTVFFYYSLSKVVHTLAILALAHIFAISFSFFTNKVYVFKSKGKSASEYWRYFFVYGNAAIIAILFTWFLTDYTNIPFWIVQALVLTATVIVTYFSHKKYTFKY